ncbi:hypothetical protein FNB79_15320 [Formosa sediminum]|uniref:Uncharacterized protein n=1 Tax=Formosa sediminum TaxID=2594004 RepID=A0A516GUT9_9FLAO|nr:hypothetical protein [Formosa sediminum]QDO95283.1 hypothetical protein FNB79_15320 [Formosa sediminum]
METLQNYFLNKDKQIKDIVLSFASHKDIQVKFKGYYIEDNDKVGAFPAQPFYQSYIDYREQNPYLKIDHIRYFFQLSKGENTHMLTVHLNSKDVFDVSFSIDELAEGFEDNTPQIDFKESDFRQLMNLINQKFDYYD